MSSKLNQIRSLTAVALVAVAGVVAALAGATGSSADAGALQLKVIAASASKVTVSWVPPANVEGYVFKVDSARVSNTWQATRSQATFGKPDASPHRYEVLAVTDAVDATVTTPAPPAPTTTTAAPAGTVIPFGAAADGTVSGDIADTSWNWFAPHVTLLAGGGPNGTNAIHLVADDSMTFPNQGALVRIHGIGLKDGTPAWINTGRDACQAISIRGPPGYTNPTQTTTDEVHGDNGTGPAPLNLTFQRGGYWRIIIRGSDHPPAFPQTIFGALRPGEQTYDGSDYRHQQDWAGGNHLFVAGEWVSFRMCWHFATDATGSFEAWALWDGSGGWRHIVPKTNLPTSYPDVSGDGHAIYPMLSLYYDVGAGVEQSVDYADGAWSDSLPALAAWQDHLLAVSG